MSLPTMAVSPEIDTAPPNSTLSAAEGESLWRSVKVVDSAVVENTVAAKRSSESAARDFVAKTRFVMEKPPRPRPAGI